MRTLVLPLCAAGLLVGCAAGGLPQVVDPSEIAAVSGGPPTITRIRDVGTPLVPRTGTIDGITDGVAGPGELLVVEGTRFGRQPTVLVGSRPASVLARTAGGGVIVRVPRGVQAGDVEVSVGTAAGTSRSKTPLRRLAIAYDGHVLRFASVGDDVKAAGELGLEGRVVRVDSTGGLALVLGDAGVTAVDLGRAQPSVLGALSLSHRAEQLVVATQAARAIAVGGGKLTVIDTTSLRRPILFDAAPAPKELAGLRAAVLSPDGKTLAVLTQGNQIAGVDVSTPTAPQLMNVIDVLPGERTTLARDLAFSPDGNTIWVVSGASAQTYPQVIPMRITAIKLVATAADGTPVEEGVAPPSGPVRRQLAVWKTQTVPGAGAPIAVVVGNAPDAQGSAIRSAPEVASVYVSVMKEATLGKHALEAAPGTNGEITRAALGAGGGPVAWTHELLGDLALLPDGERVAALAARPVAGGDSVELGIASVSIDGQATLRFAPLTTTTQKKLAPLFRLGELAVQP